MRDIFLAARGFPGGQRSANLDPLSRDVEKCEGRNYPAIISSGAADRNLPRWKKKERERENRDETIHPPERAIITSNSVLSGFDPGIIQPGQ